MKQYTSLVPDPQLYLDYAHDLKKSGQSDRSRQIIYTLIANESFYLSDVDGNGIMRTAEEIERHRNIIRQAQIVLGTLFDDSIARRGPPSAGQLIRECDHEVITTVKDVERYLRKPANCRGQCRCVTAKAWYLVDRIAMRMYAAQQPIAAEDADLLGPLNPEPSEVIEKELEQRRPQQDNRSIDREGLLQELDSLLRIRDRVRERMIAGEVPQVNAELIRERVALEQEQQRQQFLDIDQIEPEGRPIKSQHLTLIVQRWTDGGAKITADIRQERVDVIYREVVALIGRSLDDQRVNTGALRVSLHVNDLSWQETLSRLLGQVGLSWQADGDRIAISPTDYQNPDQQAVSAFAERAFLTAAADFDDPVSAEAMYRLAEQEYRNKQYYEAIDRFIEVIQRFDRPEAEFEAARYWVRQALRGYGSVMMDLKQFRDAVTVFERYLSTAADNDPTVPRVMYQAAQANLALADVGGSNQDETSAIKASDLLQRLIDRYANDSSADEQVVQARLDLGRLFFDRRQYARARPYLNNIDNLLAVRLVIKFCG